MYYSVLFTGFTTLILVNACAAAANSLTDILGLSLRGGRQEAMVSRSGDEDAEDKSQPLLTRRRRGFASNGYGLLMSSEPLSWQMKEWVVSEHNRYRKMLPATNMRMMYWSEELAASAQRHADTCDFRHSRNRVNTGENIWAAPHFYNYTGALGMWYNEVYDSRCNCNHAYKHCCGHYVQMVWAKTTLVGCGFAGCSGVTGLRGFGLSGVFVCHYNPQGNVIYGSGNGHVYAVPAFTWAAGDAQRCTECPSDAPACHEGLCYRPANYYVPQTTAPPRYSYYPVQNIRAENAALSRNSVVDWRR